MSLKLSVLIPMYNEEKVVANTAHTLTSFLSKKFPCGDYEVVFSNDGCLDGSADEDGEQSRGDGIERARMSDLLGSVETAYARDHVEGRYAVGLVNEKNAVIHGSRIPL